MKASREVKDFIKRNRKTLEAYSWDCLFLCRKPFTCKNNFKREKKLSKEEFNSIHEV